MRNAYNSLHYKLAQDFQQVLYTIDLPLQVYQKWGCVLMSPVERFAVKF